MPRIGPTELIIILVITLIIFGVGRLGEDDREPARRVRTMHVGAQPDAVGFDVDEARVEGRSAGRHGEVFRLVAKVARV